MGNGPLAPYIWGKHYQYYDTPEGEDCFKKLWYVTSYCGAYGVLGSTVDILLYSHPKGYPAILNRYAYITIPFMGMGAAFVTTVCALTNLRKKDDVVNYAWGGVAVGSIVGAWRKSLKFGFYSSLFLAAAAALKKDSIENNWPMIYVDAPRIYTSPLGIKRDYSILEDPGRTWKYAHEVDSEDK